MQTVTPWIAASSKAWSTAVTNAAVTPEDKTLSSPLRMYQLEDRTEQTGSAGLGWTTRPIVLTQPC